MVVPIGREGELQRLEVMNKLGRGATHKYMSEFVSFEPCVDEKEQLERWEDAKDIEQFHFNTPVMY